MNARTKERLTEAELDFNRTFEGEPDLVVTDEAYLSLQRIPSMEIPQPTEPLHIGRTWREPPPEREERPGDRSWRWLHWAIFAIGIGASAAMVFGNLGAQP